MSYCIRELSGKSWHEWPQTQLVEEMDALSPSPQTTSSGCSTNATPSSSRSHSPKPNHGGGHSPHDVMKLPKKDMHIFGQCPVHDDFVLVVCDLCQAAVKVEAFASHVKLRHQKASSLHGGRSSSLKSSSVDLLKTEDIFSLSTKPVLAPPIPVTNITPVVEVTAPPVPNLGGLDVEPMDIGESVVTADLPTVKVEVKKEEVSADEPMLEADNNVISIPDTEPLPPMSNDLMAMMGETDSLPTNPAASEAIVTASSHHTSTDIRLQVKSEPSEINTTTVVLTPPSVAKKLSPLKISPIITSVSGSGTGRDRKPLREYHPDKHCGVWDVDTKRHCTRALTCKSHSVVLKRKIEGRSRPFDELVAAHKKAQAEANAKAASAGSPAVTATPVIQVTRAYTPTVSVTAPPSVASVRTYSSPILTATGGGGTPSKEHEESLHYTNDHPRPLAICGFGGHGRRVGGLIVNGRNHIFTRKLVRVAITAGTAASFGGGGFHRIRPRVFIAGGTAAVVESPQASSPYVLNYNLSGNIKRPGAGATAHGGLNLTTLPPGGVVIPESFKTDIQDFKGNIKFELGRKIKHILPSGSEVTK